MPFLDNAVFLFCLGLFLGLLYVICVFGSANVPGEAPRWHPSCGSKGAFLRLRDGSLYIASYHVHHWIVYIIMLPIFLVTRLYLLVGFAIVLILQGLLYPDAFLCERVQEEEEEEEEKEEEKKEEM